VLRGGMRRVEEIEEEEIDFPKEIFERERDVLHGKEFNNSVLENYYKLQLPSKIYERYPKLDSTLSYVSMCLYLCLLYIYSYY
jgi:hypothetical protein